MNFRITDEHRYSEKAVAVFKTQVMTEEGELALDLLRQWGPVVGHPDGEDSAGNSRIRPMTPEETATRAFDIAAQAMKIAAERGLIVHLPDLNEINADIDAKRKAKETDEV